MVRSGLQGDVIKLYRQCMRNALSKPSDVQPAFLLHVRYNFRNPQLRQRDYTAIEHQLRKMTRTLETLSEPSVRRISVSSEMEEWWQNEIRSGRGSRSQTGSESGSGFGSGSGSNLSPHEAKLEELKAGEKDVRERGDSEKGEAQWGHTLPGHGGT